MVQPNDIDIDRSLVKLEVIQQNIIGPDEFLKVNTNYESDFTEREIGGKRRGFIKKNLQCI